jgi:hypothetical protein
MPTPTTQDGSNNCGPSQVDRNSLNATVGGPLNPEWVEWLQGFPRGWTSLEPLSKEAFDDWFRKSSGEGESWWAKEPPIPRMLTGVPNRVSRLAAIGDSQVPVTVALAWKILTNNL